MYKEQSNKKGEALKGTEEHKQTQSTVDIFGQVQPAATQMGLQDERTMLRDQSFS
jgi:hypothetical protein